MDEIRYCGEGQSPVVSSTTWIQIIFQTGSNGGLIHDKGFTAQYDITITEADQNLYGETTNILVLFCMLK